MICEHRTKYDTRTKIVLYDINSYKDLRIQIYKRNPNPNIMVGLT